MNKPGTIDIFTEFEQKCPVCLMGQPDLVDDSDNPNRAIISTHQVFTYQCDKCGFRCPGHVKADNLTEILDSRWNEKSKILIASWRYNLGVSIIDNKLSAWAFYFTHQMVA
jgi:hypothetical protein